MQVQLILLNIICLVFSVDYAQSRNVFIEVGVPWPKYITSPIVEVSEYLNQQQSKQNIFWKFIDSICTKSSNIDFLVSKGDNHSMTEIESIAIHVASTILPSTSSILFLETLQGLNTFSPSVEFYNSLSLQYGSPCGVGKSFVILWPAFKVICKMNELPTSDADFEKLLTSTSMIPSDYNDEEYFDHIFPTSSSSSTSNNDNDTTSSSSTNGIQKNKKIILFGNIGTSSFCQFHSFLSHLPLIKSGTIPYSVRHSFAGLSPLLHEQELQGFGVFLDIKNMEYKTVDDSENTSNGKTDSTNDSTAAANKVIQFTENEEVAGINFSQLLKRKSTLGPEFQILRSELLEQLAGDAQEMKVWKMKELGLQTIQAMLLSNQPIQKLIEIIQNFPLQAPSLSALKISQNIKDDVNSFYSNLNGGGGLGSLLNGLYVNGNRIDLSTNSFNVYDMLLKIHDELSHVDFIANLVKSNEGKNIVLKAIATVNQPAGTSSSDDEEESSELELSNSDNSQGTASSVLPAELSSIVRIDLTVGSKNVIVFANNLEKDAKYTKKWPKQLQQLTFPSWQLHAIARNLYTLVLVVDPLSIQGANLILQASSIYAQQYPVRIGFLSICDATNHRQGSAGWKRCHQINQLFAMAKDAFSHPVACSFLFDLSEGVSNSVDYVVGMSDSELIHMFTSSVSQKLAESSSKKAAAVTADQIESLASTVLSGKHPDVAVYKEYNNQAKVYQEARGLPLNTYSLNGIIRPASEDLNSLMQLLGREQYILAQFVQANLITDKTSSIFSTLLKLYKAYPRYHTMLDEPVIPYHDFSSSDISFVSQLPYIYTKGLSASKADTKSVVVNTTILAVPYTTAASYESIASALSWLHNKQNLADTHRLAIIMLLSEDTVSCLQSLVSSSSSSSGGSTKTDTVAITQSKILYTKSCSSETFEGIWKLAITSQVLTDAVKTNQQQQDNNVSLEVLIKVLRQLVQSSSLSDAVNQVCESNDQECSNDIVTIQMNDYINSFVTKITQPDEDEEDAVVVPRSSLLHMLQVARSVQYSII